MSDTKSRESAQGAVFDKAYLKVVEAALSEWRSEHDEQDFSDLQDPAYANVEPVVSEIERAGKRAASVKRKSTAMKPCFCLRK